MNSLTLFLTALQDSPQASVDWVGIAGIVGTLLGAALGSFVTWKIQSLQLAHEDKTRFHERKLAIYSDFTASASVIIAIKRTDSERILLTRLAEAQESEIKNFELLRYVASQNVFKAAISIHGLLTKLTDAQETISDSESHAFYQTIADFSFEARKELGVDMQSA